MQFRSLFRDGPYGALAAHPFFNSFLDQFEKLSLDRPSILPNCHFSLHQKTPTRRPWRGSIFDSRFLHLADC